jgi:hypothetical protein
MKRSNVFSNSKELTCKVCGKSLFEKPGMSMINIIMNTETDKIVSVVPCCKGKCDKSIKANKNEVSGWKDLIDFTNPYLFIKHVMSVFNSMYDGEGFENKEAFEEYKDLLLTIYPYVTRDLTDEENESAILANAMPF